MEEEIKLRIKDLDKADRPREKLLQHGADKLSDAELLAILIRTGMKGKTAIDLAQQMIHDAEGLKNLGRLSVHELSKLKGMGKVKAITIAAAFELARRKLMTVEEEKIKVHDSSVIGKRFMYKLGDMNVELFYIVLMNRRNEIIREIDISKGGVAGTVADPKIIFKHALENTASALIVVHNHPSGNLKPSDADKEITKKLVESGKMLEVQVLDHVIVSKDGYFSFADEGLL